MHTGRKLSLLPLLIEYVFHERDLKQLNIAKIQYSQAQSSSLLGYPCSVFKHSWVSTF